MNLPSELSLEDRRLFWRDYDKWCAMFNQQLVDEQLMTLPVRDIVEERLYPLRDAYDRSRAAPTNVHGVHRHLGKRNTYYRFTNKGGWEKSVFVPCDVYMVPNQYQSARHSDMINAIMHKLYPWLANFKCNFYSLSFYPNSIEEFYVRTAKDYNGHRSLYVPYAAFMAHDVAAIEKRNEKYLRWYTKGEATWNALREDPEVVAFLLMV